jgi:hypothetical protein
MGFSKQPVASKLERAYLLWEKEFRKEDVLHFVEKKASSNFCIWRILPKPKSARH